MRRISSLAKPGRFNNDTVKPLAEFYDGVNELSSRIRVLSSSLEKFDTGADSLTNTDFYVTLDKLSRSLIEPLNVARNYASLGQLNRTIDADRMESGFAGSHTAVSAQ